MKYALLVSATAAPLLGGSPAWAERAAPPQAATVLSDAEMDKVVAGVVIVRGLYLPVPDKNIALPTEGAQILTTGTGPDNGGVTQIHRDDLTPIPGLVTLDGTKVGNFQEKGAVFFEVNLNI